MRVIHPLLIALMLSAGASAALADSKIHGSIPLPAESGHETKRAEATEAKRLAPLAKISRDQAVAAAKKVASGKVKSAALDNEDGFLVFAVTIGKREVLVDAGNAKILANEPADD